MNILEKHNLAKKLVSAAAMSFALLGGTYLVNNQTTQTVQAARRVVHVNTVSGYNHYRKLANRKGTHYFGYTAEIASWAMGADNYTMQGKHHNDYDGNMFPDADIVGTKTINGKHFFIVDNHPGHFLVLAKDYYAPTSYQVKRGQTVQTWNQEEDDDDEGNIHYANAAGHRMKYGHGAHFMVLDKRGSRNTFTDANGVVYRAVVDTYGYSMFIKQSDLATKMHKTAHTFRLNGAKFNSRGRLIGGIN